MGILSLIGSAVCGFISSTISSIGPMISNFAKNAFNIIAKIPIPDLKVSDIISIAAKIVHSVVDFLGIKSEENPEILGAKAEQSEKHLDDFDDDVVEYIKYLKEEVELDKEKFDNMTPEEKLGCKAVGMALETKAIEEKIGGVEISPECLATLIKIQAAGIKIDAGELVGIIRFLKTQGITNLNDVVELFEGKGESDRVKTEEVLANAIGEGANEKILNLKHAVRKYEDD